MATDSSTATGSTDNDVQRTRAWTGLYVVLLGDLAIALASIIAVLLISRHTAAAPAGAGAGATGSGIDTSAMVSILTSAFTAIGTMTTAYFGIRAATNTAQSHIKAVDAPDPKAHQKNPPDADPTVDPSAADGAGGAPAPPAPGAP